MHDERPLLAIRDLWVRRGGRRIIEGLSLEIRRGSPFAILGASGSGKTTLLFAAAGLLPIERGSVRVMGEDVGELHPRRRSRLLGIVFQDYQLFSHLTAWENVMLAPSLQRREGAESLARDLMKELRIDGLAGRRPHELSGGQKQRVAIARSLVLEPRILFFDEPSAALDSRTSEELADLLVRINERTQVVVVSHDMAFVESCAPRGIRMEGGRIRAAGALEAIA